MCHFVYKGTSLTITVKEKSVIPVADMRLAGYQSEVSTMSNIITFMPDAWTALRLEATCAAIGADVNSLKIAGQQWYSGTVLKVNFKVR